jgi:hypothetical protein
MGGFDELQKILEEAQGAVKSLEGNFATLPVDPNNPQAAVAEMERAVDAKLAPYRGNAIVDQLADATKEEFKKHILEQAEEAKGAE